MQPNERALGGAAVGQALYGTANNVVYQIGALSLRLETRLLKYLPPWVRATDAFIAIIKSVAYALALVYAYAETIGTMFVTDKSARMTAKDWGMLLAGNELDSNIQGILADRFAILQARGTEAGVLSDLQTLAADTSASTSFDPDRGWVVDETYPDDEYCYADLDTVHLAVISYTNNSQRSDTEIKSLIRKYIVPLNVQIVYS